MFTNTEGCTVYEKTVCNRSPTYVRHCLGKLYREHTSAQSGGDDRTDQGRTLLIIPESSVTYMPKKDDRIVCGIIEDEKPPTDALTVTEVRDFRFGSVRVRHIEVIAR